MLLVSIGLVACRDAQKECNEGRVGAHDAWGAATTAVEAKRVAAAQRVASAEEPLRQAQSVLAEKMAQKVTKIAEFLAVGALWQGLRGVPQQSPAEALGADLRRLIEACPRGRDAYAQAQREFKQSLGLFLQNAFEEYPWGPEEDAFAAASTERDRLVQEEQRIASALSQVQAAQSAASGPALAARDAGQRAGTAIRALNDASLLPPLLAAEQAGGAAWALCKDVAP